MESPYITTRIIQSSLDLKAKNLLQINLAGKSSLADYILICHGTSTVHTRGIADKISLDLKKEGILPLGVEGYESGEWILLDYNTAIIHIFLEETRRFYNLEEVYMDFETETFE